MRVLIALLVVVAILAPGVVAAQESPCQGRVTMQLFTGLNVRDGIWGPRVGYVYRGAGVDIYGRDYDVLNAPWYEIRWGDGYYWIHGWFVRIETPESCAFEGVH